MTCPMDIRKKVWERLGHDLKPSHLNDEIVSEISLNELPQVLEDILQGKVRGRTIVTLSK